MCPVESSPIVAADVGEIGPCCALQFCQLKDRTITNRSHNCRKCHGVLHSPLCAVPDSGEEAWVTCLFCGQQPSPSHVDRPPTVVTQDSPVSPASVSDKPAPESATASNAESSKCSKRARLEALAKRARKHARREGKFAKHARRELVSCSSNKFVFSSRDIPNESALKAGLSLSSVLDKCVSIKNAPWNSRVPFKGHLCLLMDTPPIAGDPQHNQELDLFSLTDAQHKGWMFRFDPGQFPRGVGGFDSKNPQLKVLKNALSLKCSEVGGFTLISDGIWHDHCRMMCNQLRFHKPSTKPKASGELRKHSLVCGKKNQRKGKVGKEAVKFAKGTSTQRPVAHKGDCTCRCSLFLSFDQHSFFVLCGMGSGTHQGHLPATVHEKSVVCSHLPNDVKKMAMQCAVSCVPPGAASRSIGQIHGVTINRQTVARNTQMSKLALTLVGAEAFQQQTGSKGEVDIVFDHLKETNQIFTALFHRKEKNGSENLFLETGAGGSSSEGQTIPQTGPGESNESVMNCSRETRESVGAAVGQDVLVALVWMSPHQLQAFEAFPEQLFIDGTHKREREGWEPITTAVSDMSGKPQIVIKCWAPNNRAWFFKWLFESAVVTLVGKEICSQVRLMLSDGDSQECSQLDSAIAVVFTNAVRRRCGWHIVDRGWTRFPPKTLGVQKSAKKKFKDVCGFIQLVKGWLHSLMKEIETVPEHRV